MLIVIKTDSDKPIPVLWFNEGIMDESLLWSFIKLSYKSHKTHELKIIDESFKDSIKIKFEGL